MDILNDTNKVASKELIQLKMSLDWANTMNVRASPPFDPDPQATVVEQLIERLDNGSFIFPEPEPRNGYVMKSLDWRLSTLLGLYLAEGLARAFQDTTKASMLYRQASDAKQSYVRYLNIINSPARKEGYRDGKLDWVQEDDARWNSSILPWEVWAPQNGYMEIGITIQRYGYGYGFSGVPIKLATTVLVIYALMVSTHIVLTLVSGRTYKGYSSASEMLALAWNSAPVKELNNTSAGIENVRTWRQVIRVREGRRKQLQFVLGDDGPDNVAATREPRAGTKYA